MSFRTRINGSEVVVSKELLHRYDRPAPRYTSYPTAPIWTNKFSSKDLTYALTRSNARSLSLYFHIPFCEKRCLFCGCSTIATRHHSTAEAYIDALEKELSLIAPILANEKKVVQLHFGGGTPTFLSCAQLKRLWGSIASHFTFDNDAEIGIEIDPRVTTLEQLELLRELGFNRASLGLQDTSVKVQEAIGRIEPLVHVIEMMNGCRKLGYRSVNLDLIYGLPCQTEMSFETTIQEVARLSPDRIALFNFAYLPKMLHHQRGIQENELPQPDEKFNMFCTAIDALGEAGYEFIGMDHFAKKDDELSIASRKGTLWRNFQGYTTKSGTDLIGFGLTSISDVNGCYAQNEKKLIGYYRKIRSKDLATVRGWKLTEEDLARRRVIRDIFCKGTTDISDLPPSFKLPTSLEKDGLIEMSGSSLSVTPLGRLFVRNIAMAFDAYLGTSAGTFSRAV